MALNRRERFRQQTSQLSRAGVGLWNIGTIAAIATGDFMLILCAFECKISARGSIDFAGPDAGRGPVRAGHL